VAHRRGEQVTRALLSAAEINAALRTTDITSYWQGQLGIDPGEVFLAECRPGWFVESNNYAGSSWSASTEEILKDASTTHWVAEAVVQFPSAREAADFINSANSKWSACAGQSVTQISGRIPSQQRKGRVTRNDAMLSFSHTQTRHLQNITSKDLN
jgi:PknH-like extracellular domain